MVCFIFMTNHIYDFIGSQVAMVRLTAPQKPTNFDKTKTTHNLNDTLLQGNMSYNVERG